VKENSGHDLLIGKYPWKYATFNGQIDTLEILPYVNATPPAPPSNLQATVSPAGINLTWEDNSNNEYGFIIGRYSWLNPYGKHDTITVLPNVTSYSDTKVLSDTRYTYSVGVFNRLGIFYPENVNPVDISTDRIISPDIALLMHFNENVKDESKNSLMGSWVGLSEYAEGHDNTGHALNLSDGNYVDVDNSDLLGGMDQLNISVWAKKNNAETGGHLVHKHVQYELWIGQRTVRCYVGNEDGELARVNIYSVPEIDNTMWHHYAVKYDGASVRLLWTIWKLETVLYPGR